MGFEGLSLGGDALGGNVVDEQTVPVQLDAAGVGVEQVVGLHILKEGFEQRMEGFDPFAVF